MASQQFTLRRLFINMSVVCVVLAFAVTFPRLALSLTLLLLLYLPALIVLGIACYFSTKPKRTSLIVSVGAIVSWILSPRMFVSWGEPPTFWDLFMVDFQTVGVFTAFGALVFAVLDWIISTASRRPTPHAR
jgi:hypothetical protein